MLLRHNCGEATILLAGSERCYGVDEAIHRGSYQRRNAKTRSLIHQMLAISEANMKPKLRYAPLPCEYPVVDIRGFCASVVDTCGMEARSPSWPENRRAPGRLELVRRLLNTAQLESQSDVLVSRDDVSQWLASEGYAPGRRVNQQATENIRDFRERLRNSIESPSVPATDTTDWLFDSNHTAVQFVLVEDVPLLEGADAEPTARYLTTLTLIIGEALRDGLWDRFRTCANSHCRWAFYDNSKNGSGRWCSMDTCGAKNKISAFRARSG